MKTHADFMRRALQLAARGEGQVNPNPMVGCVVVKNNKIVCEGFHPIYGGPHAEVVALKKAGKAAKGATVYVTLEPCSHWGKTPPCAPALIEAGIKSVFIAMKDPNPLVSGRGIQLLKKSRLNVSVGLLGNNAQELNQSFVTWMTKKRPYTLLKLAMTMDGKIASRTGSSRWVTSSLARTFVHKLRANSDAVLVGATTANQDNPKLTAHGTGRNPLRIVIDPTLRSKPTLSLYNDRKAKTIIMTSSQASAQRIATMRKKGVTTFIIPRKKEYLDVRYLSHELGKRNISRLLIEGGGETAWPFLKENLVDEVLIFIAPKIIGGRTAPTAVGGEGIPSMLNALKLKFTAVGTMGPDILIRARRA
jgi:diaminohydroxyphosphoribosylaminopyrimidine deaminase / 5-amino-6-(5-phosphoribosylamino)uracil reductase